MRPLMVELRRGYGRIRRATPWQLAFDLRRAARLRRFDPPLRAREHRAERLVVTLTTVPKRVDHILPVLRSLLDQTCPADRILLAWPERALRGGQPYPEVPRLPPGIDLLRCDDQGPATKVLPALRAEPKAALIAVDDDIIYPINFIATLLSAHRADPTAALGWRGCRIQAGVDPRNFDHVFATAIDSPTIVDVLMGVWGYLLPQGVLDEAVHDFRGWPADLRWNDDYWISGHLARRGVSRRVIPGRGLPLSTDASVIAALADDTDAGQIRRIAIAAFAAWW